jgi:hypothetical protein
MAATGPSVSALRLGLFTAQVLIECHAEFLASIHQTFIGLKIGGIFRHRILAEIALALLVKPPADLAESFNRFEQRLRIPKGSLQRP